ncbi:hypothetical protein BBK82_08165 [Lentzea guizhouensis]|uniref:RNA polymerase sigma factor 70 region 4 type 2 domain-containing protein n=1 Tax=Lentzea guizhouensis TaxID=1586287 RepID=A0A1B2HEC4_9PSEU|nr:sigma-70 family RNA polymerase sigma factor [Lentzea guizhouensis]ANZ36046.1 hypothetical protein BBK82_08165 [Lentzea guizhouensis]
MTGTLICVRTVCLCARQGLDLGICVQTPSKLDADFVEFHDRHRVTFLKYARLRGLSSYDAEDVVSEAFLAMYRSRHAWRASTRPEAFAFTVVHGKLVDYCRKRDRQPRVVSATMDDERTADEVGGLIIRLDLERLLNQLPQQQAACVALRAFAGCDTGEISQYLGIAASAVRSHLQAARRRLRTELGVDLGEVTS